jgi:hypothetical protein
VKLSDVGAHALSNLARHKLRTALTLCGVGVGVATLTVMVSLGEGVRKLIEDQVDKAELVTRITVLPGGSSGQLPPFMRRNRGNDRQEEDDDKPGKKLDDASVASFEAIPGVIVAFPDVHAPIMGVEVGDQVQRTETEGVPFKAITDNFRNALLAGRYWTADEESARVVVAPSDALEELGIDPARAVGMKVFFCNMQTLERYDAQPVVEATPPTGTDGKALPPMRLRYVRPAGAEVWEAEIIGVYKSEDFGMTGRRFQAPMTFGRVLLQKSGWERMLGSDLERGEYRALTVKVESRTQVPAIRAAIEAKGYDTFAVDDILKVIRVVFAVIDTLLALFGGIGLVVSFFGIANTMVMAVLERTREIGVLKALGARDRDVRRIFLAEATAIGMTGGGLGVLFGWGIGLGLNALASYVMAEQLSGKSIALFYVPPLLALLAIGISTFVAAIAGLYPAWRAARLDPVESLRME